MAGERPSQKYHLGGRIGGGGMAEVFEATLIGAEGFLRPVAVKRIQPSLSSDAIFGQMFVNEARIASFLHHANIAAVLDFDRDEEGRYFLVMELIRGVDLRRLADTGRLPIAISVHIAAEMLRGLDYAHELEQDGRRLGIVHRDISPHNVMVSWDGSVKLVDFGIAKAMAATGISRAGTIKGKVAYMSPEQAHAMELDGRTDVFAVGVVLHELLVGERLFRGNTEPEILARLLNQPIPRPTELAPDVPADLDHVVMKLLERDRDARYLSAHAALEALLATSVSSPRAGLELEQLLGERFPGEAPRRRAAAVDVIPAAIAPTLPAHPVGQTLPAGPAGMAAARAAPLAMFTPTGPAAAGATPAAFGDRAFSPVPLPARRSSRGLPWRAGAVLALVAAGATTTALMIRERSAGTVAASAASGDAGAASADERPPRPARTPEETPAKTPAEAPVAPGPADAGSTEAPGEELLAEDRPAAVLEDHGERKPRGRESRRRESRRAEPGYLDVAVDPWASLTVDGKSYGQTPKKIALPPGSHRVVLRNIELDKVETMTVKIRSGETSSLDFNWR
jgi:tRNA A-37 threonylcarbamoyl transferase component Bud32